MTQKITYVLDARALIVGALPLQSRELYVTEGVLEEARGTPETASRAIAYLEAGTVKKVDIDDKDVRVAREWASKIGEDRLSDVDLEVAAAAIVLSRRRGKVMVLTDDYALQNLLSSIDIGYERITHRGILKQVTYRYRCSACGKVFRRSVGQCPNCGSRVRRVRSTARKVTRSPDP